MTDARKRAEEALARWDALPSGDVDDLAAWDVARDGMERFRALLASEPAKGAETLGPRECGGRCHDAVDSRTPCPGCAAEMAAPPDTADARRAAEATARYLLGVADEARLGEFESELVDCIRALLAAEPATERETRLEAAYQREHARLTEVLGALSEVLPPGAEIRPALLALKARAEAAEPAKEACAEFIRTMAKGKCAWTPEEGTTSCDGLGGVCAGHAAERFLAAPPDGAEVREAAERLHPYADWHEDDGPVLWYAVPVEEPPYCGEPLFSDWPKEWNAPYDTVTGAFIDGPYTGKVLMWQRLPELPLLAALRSDGR